LAAIVRDAQLGQVVHVICDNLSTHEAPVVQRWLLAHPRFVLHFTPTYSSWINQVERWLAELQRRCLERGVFCSLDELNPRTRRVDQPLERRCPALHLDPHPRPDHRPHLPLLLTHLQTGSSRRFLPHAYRA
jgi:DDE superfamily endonuclease